MTTTTMTQSVTVQVGFDGSYSHREVDVRTVELNTTIRSSPFSVVTLGHNLDIIIGSSDAARILSDAFHQAATDLAAYETSKEEN